MLALAGQEGGVEFKPTQTAWLHPGRAAEVWRADRLLGVVGHHREVERARELHEISRFPSVRRDLAVVVAEELDWAQLERCLRSTLGDLLKDVWVFDQYRGPGLEAGFKSIAMGLILQDGSRTLTDQDADHCVSLAVSALAIGCKAKLRGQDGADEG